MSGMVKEERGMPMSEFLVRFCDLKGLFIVKVFSTNVLPSSSLSLLPPPSPLSPPFLPSLFPQAQCEAVTVF